MGKTMFTPEEKVRYHRHFILPEIGLDGQQKLKTSSVLIVGVGGLGSPLAQTLTMAGIGHLGLVDFDVVEGSNLQRQPLYGTQDIGKPKLEVAKQQLHRLNPAVEISLFPTLLEASNAEQIISNFDIVADGTDNFATRYLVNDVCVWQRKPNVYASIFRFEGQVSVLGYQGAPCYRCLYPQPPPSELVPACSEAGVLGVLPSLIGNLQATEVLKILLGIGEILAGKLLLVDALRTQFHHMEIEKNPDCPVCGNSPTITAPIDYEAFCGQTVIPEITVSALKEKLQNQTSLLLVDVREPFEHAQANLTDWLIPLGSLEEKLYLLQPFKDQEIVVYCKTGQRSAKAVHLLQHAGFKKVSNLKYGLDAYLRDAQDSSST